MTSSVITPAYTFIPGDVGSGRIDFSGFSGFALSRLVSIVNVSRDLLLFDPVKAGPSSLVGAVLYLGVNTSHCSPNDVLQITYDEGASSGGSVIVNGSSYETVAASQTDQVMGASGASGDYLGGVLVVPATTSPGAVSIKDGSGTAITLFTGGTDSVSNLVPFMVPFGAKSTGGAWKVTTGANVSAVAVGTFS